MSRPYGDGWFCRDFALDCRNFVLSLLGWIVPRCKQGAHKAQRPARTRADSSLLYKFAEKAPHRAGLFFFAFCLKYYTIFETNDKSELLLVRNFQLFGDCVKYFVHISCLMLIRLHFIFGISDRLRIRNIYK